MLLLDMARAGFEDIIDSGQEARLLADSSDGLIFTEGPIWHEAEAHLTFSDIAGNCMYRWSERDGLTQWAAYSYKANGNAYAPNGDVVTCEHATSRIVARNGAGKEYRVLASHYQGRELNSPNDVIVRSDGAIYFTDPYFGRNPSIVGVERSRELSVCGVYGLAQNGLTLLDDQCQTPNGLCLSADERKLYVADSRPMEILIYDVCADGSLENRRVFARTTGEGIGLPDGLKLDARGNLYCCAQGGIHVFDPDGALLGRIAFAFQIANFTFGGPDGRTMMICARDKLLSIRTKIPGLAWRK